MTIETMTSEQIENWRRVLVSMIGPYALMMPEKEIMQIRDTFQSRIDNISTEKT